MILIIITSFIAVVYILSKVKRKMSRSSDSAASAGFGIQMTEVEIDLERQSIDDIMRLLEGTISASGYFRRETIPMLMATLKSGTAPYARFNMDAIFKGDSFLSVEEKRSLGLNTRMKYSRRFLEYWNPASFQKIEPKSTLSCMYYGAFHRVSRKNAIESYKKLGFVKTIRIHPDDCAQIKQAKKRHPIDRVPDLPLPECNAEFCRCSFEAVIPRDG
jgi:hypothetical protein